MRRVIKKKCSVIIGIILKILKRDFLMLELDGTKLLGITI